MSLKAGWYIQWNKAEPRKSGAFTIEVIERAPRNILSPQSVTDSFREGFRSLSSYYTGETIQDITPDTANKELRAGDQFRLRSVKFPEYELGITTKHLEGEYCYLGLQKNEKSNGDDWCHTTIFTAKHK